MVRQAKRQFDEHEGEEVPRTVPGAAVVKKARLDAVESVVDEGDSLVARRSSRIYAKEVMSSRETCPEDVQARSLAANKGKRTRKPPTGGPRIVRRRKNSNIGRLEMIMEMPVEIFCEIAVNLTPHDLLNLARSSKSLRGFLMTKDSKLVWRTARESVGLPECPPDLSEPQFADLLYCKGCYFCTASRAQTLHFPFRLRLCKNCSEKRLNLLSFVARAYSFLDVKLYYVNQAEEVFTKYHSFKSDLELQLYVQDRKALVASIMDNSKKVSEWIQFEKSRRQAEQRIVSKKREEKIQDNLRALGYSDMDLDPSPLDGNDLLSKWRKLVREPKMLTDRIWKNVLPHLKGLIAERRVRREEHERRVINDRLSDEYDIMLPNNMLPSFGDFLQDLELDLDNFLWS
ncbi:hypothetical protein M0805_008711 [Coniferiporia weirii]|nr:hypothetical protein M0805_008711 [Coniferiporia weirii]